MKNEEIANHLIGSIIMHFISILIGFGVFCALSIADTHLYYLIVWSFMASSATTMFLMIWRYDL